MKRKRYTLYKQEGEWRRVVGIEKIKEGDICTATDNLTFDLIDGKIAGFVDAGFDVGKRACHTKILAYFRRIV